MNFFKKAGKIYHFSKPNGKKFLARIITNYGHCVEMQDMSWNGERFFISAKTLRKITGLEADLKAAISKGEFK